MTPTVSARPESGKSDATIASASGARSSTSEIARASAPVAVADALHDLVGGLRAAGHAREARCSM